MMKKILAFLKDEEGIETAEYAVMGALVAIASIVAARALGVQISAVYDAITTALALP